MCRYRWGKPNREEIREQIRERMQENMQAMTRLQEGIRRPVKTKNIDQEVVFQADTEVVEGIGDAARALPRLNQLAVLDGDRILYIVVEVDPDRAVNTEHCKRLARAILR